MAWEYHGSNAGRNVSFFCLIRFSGNSEDGGANVLRLRSEIRLSMLADQNEKEH
jgi:hypothetical protein